MSKTPDNYSEINEEVKASFFPLVFGAWFYKNEFLIKQVNYLFKAINFNAKKGIFHGGGECSSHHDVYHNQVYSMLDSCCGIIIYSWIEGGNAFSFLVHSWKEGYLWP